MKKLLFIFLMLISSLVLGQATGKIIANKPTGDTITLDTITVYSKFNLKQTTAGQTISVASWSSSTQSKTLYIRNTGSVNVTVLTLTTPATSAIIPPYNGVLLDWVGSYWNIIGKYAGGEFLPLAGGTMSGDINMGGQGITNISSIFSTGYIATESNSGLSFLYSGGLGSGIVIDDDEFLIASNDVDMQINSGDGFSIYANEVRIDSNSIDASLKTGYLRMPVGTTTQRPVTPLVGMFRYNSTTAKNEYYENGVWKNIAPLSALDDYLPLAGGTMLGPIDMGGNDITITNINSPNTKKTIEVLDGDFFADAYFGFRVAAPSIPFLQITGEGGADDIGISITSKGDAYVDINGLRLPSNPTDNAILGNRLLMYTATSSLSLPVGTTGQRPATFMSDGQLRHNSTFGRTELYQNLTWDSLVVGADLANYAAYSDLDFYLPLAGGTMEGTLDMGSSGIDADHINDPVGQKCINFENGVDANDSYIDMLVNTSSVDLTLAGTTTNNDFVLKSKGTGKVKANDFQFVPYTGNAAIMSAANSAARTYTFQNASGTVAFLSDITGGGTVTDVSVVTANGISGTVATSTTTPAITLSLGAITPTTVNGLTLSGIGGSTVSFGTGGTVLYNGGSLGTPSSGTLTNCTGLSVTTGVTGILPGTNGGTGINNGSNTLTLSGNLATTGAFNPTFSIPRTTTWTFPNTASETLAGLGTAQTFTAKQTFTAATTEATALTLLDATYKTALDVSASGSVRVGGNGSFTTVVIGANTTQFTNAPTLSTPSAGIIIKKPTSTGGTSGDAFILSLQNTSFLPTTGSGTFEGLQIIPTINQTNGGVAPTGVMSMIDVNPTVSSVITSLHGIRSRITASPTGGGTTYNIYADGTAPNLFGGTVTMKGFTDASSASAGNVGEVIASGTSTYTNYTTTATYQAVDSITLTAGDWDLSAFFTYSSNAATITAASNAIFVISTTKASASGSTEGMNIAYVPQAALLGTSKFSDAISPYQVTINSTTKYYLNSQATFTLGNPQYVGRIRARRIR